MALITRRRLMLSSGALVAAAAAGGARAQSDETATLTVQTFGGDAELAGVTAAIARFNQSYPNVTVEVSIDPISTGWGDYVTKVLGQFNAGRPADVYGTAIETFRAFAARGLWLPLDDFLKEASFSDLAPSLIAQSAYDGVTSYVPIGWNNIMTNYNRALFDAAGVAYPPRRGQTWDQFRETAMALTQRDAAGNVVRFGYEVPNQNFFVQPWFLTNGTSVLNADWTGSNMLDPRVAETLQFLHDLIHVDGVSPVPGADTLDNQFMAGQVAMISRGQWIVQNARANGLDMDIAAPPVQTTEATVIGFGGYAIARDTARPDIAKALVVELTSRETQREMGDRGGGVPGRRDAISPEFLAFPPSADLYYETLPFTIPVPSPANFQEVEKIFIRHYGAMMAGDESISDGTAAAHAELEDSFARLREQGG